MLYGDYMGITFPAAEDLLSHIGFAVTLDDGKIANSGEEASGILMNKPANGEGVSCGTVGDLPFQAGGAITKGNKLTVTTSGYVITAGSGYHIVGKAITTTTSGSVGRGQFNFNTAIYAMSSDFVA